MESPQSLIEICPSDNNVCTSPHEVLSRLGHCDYEQLSSICSLICSFFLIFFRAFRVKHGFVFDLIDSDYQDPSITNVSMIVCKKGYTLPRPGNNKVFCRYVSPLTTIQQDPLILLSELMSFYGEVFCLRV